MPLIHTIFHCERCGVEHDYSQRDGLLHTIAHLHYHYFQDLEMTNTPDGNLRYADGAVEWFDGHWGEGVDYFSELVDSGYAQFAPYYLSYKEVNDGAGVENKDSSRP